jgi:hypothetical protein
VNYVRGMREIRGCRVLLDAAPCGGVRLVDFAVALHYEAERQQKLGSRNGKGRVNQTRTSKGLDVNGRQKIARREAVAH